MREFVSATCVSCPRLSGERTPHGRILSSRAFKPILFVSLMVGSGGAPCRAGLPSVPVEQWRWDGRAAGESEFCLATCLAARVTDTNGDGVIDALDGPDVLVPHETLLAGTRSISVLDGRTGALRRSITAPPSFDPNILAIGDLDGDGRPDILTSDGRDLLAFHDDGSFFLRRPFPESLPGYAALGLADIDEDGLVDVVAGRSALLGDGASWLGTGGAGRNAISSRSVAFDLDPTQPGMEVVAGNTLYGAFGQLLWQAPVADGLPAVADITGSGEPSVVLVTRSNLFLIDREGTVVGGLPTPFPSDALPAPPLVADVDGDGEPEVVVATTSAIAAYEWTAGAFEVKWSTPVRVAASIPGSTAFDFDCDGASEIVYRDEDRWYVIDGDDGSVAHQQDFPSGTGEEMPVVANLDDDPAAEIVVPAQARHVIVFEVPGSAMPRALFNQMTYHATNVLDDGTIPTPEAPSWLANNSYLAQEAAIPSDPCGLPCPTPTLDAIAIVDPSDCNLGLDVSWEPATFPSGSGTHSIYRSDDTQGLSATDALSRAPVATGLMGTRWTDMGTRVGGQYLYVVEAEDGSAAEPGCAPTGTTNGGTIARSASGVMPDVGTQSRPAGVGAVLRATSTATDVVLSWPTVRALLPGEHFHVKRSPIVPGTFDLANAEGWSASAWQEPFGSEPLVFYDLRIANGCEDESPVDFPPGR